MKDIQDLLDDLEDTAYNRDNYKISGIRKKIDEWLDNKIEMQSCQEDLKGWIIDNRECIEESILKSTIEVSKIFLKRAEVFDITNVVDRDVLVSEVTGDIIQGILNVVDTYGGKNEEFEK